MTETHIPTPAILHTTPSTAARIWVQTERFIRGTRSYGVVIVLDALGTPLLYLMAMGLGLGALIGADGTTVDGVSYITFIAPALLAGSAMMSGVIETTFPVMAGFRWHKHYYSTQATTLLPWHMGIGHAIGVGLRLLVQSLLFFLIMLVFGVVDSGWGWLQIFTAALGGLAIGLPLMAYAATLQKDSGQFTLINRFVVMPMFLFSATFYPLSALPVWLQWIGWISPQWHSAQLGRIANYGMDNPLWLSIFHLAYLLILTAVGAVLVGKIFTLRLDDRLKKPKEKIDREEPESLTEIPPMPEVAPRTGMASGMYSGNIRSVIARGMLSLKSSNWGIFASGFIEPVLYLASMGLGLRALVGEVEGPAGPMTYGAFIAPALLAVSAMNGAIFDSTWNVFFKLKIGKTYQPMLNTSLGPVDVAMGEIFMALFRGTIYSTAFLLVMGIAGFLDSWWAIAMIPCAVIVAFGFAAIGMAITSFMTTFQQMDLISLVLMPMFLFSATFFPITVYPEAIQWFIKALPLWHAVEMMRQLAVGVFSMATLGHLAYFVAMIVIGVTAASLRMRALFLR